MAKCFICGKSTTFVAMHYYLLDNFGLKTKHEICPECNAKLVQNGQAVQYDAKTDSLRIINARTKATISVIKREEKGNSSVDAKQAAPSSTAKEAKPAATPNKPADKKPASSKKKWLILAALVPVCIALAIFLIGPQCSYKVKVSSYREEQCTNHTGFQRLKYCKDHMYLEELPRDMIQALDTWDYDLMKKTLDAADTHEMKLTTNWKVSDHIKELGAKNCRFPYCKLYIPSDLLFCPEHEYAQAIMNEFRAAITDYDVQKINQLHDESSAMGMPFTSHDRCMHDGIKALIDSYLADYHQSSVADLALRLHHLTTLFKYNFNLETDSFDKLMFLVRTQGMNLKKMDPSQGFYAGEKNSSYSSNNGLLKYSGGRTYGYNYCTTSRSGSAAALNGGPTIESSSAVYYKDISVGDSLGQGIWAVETPEFDLVNVSDESIYFIDNSQLDIAYKFYVTDFTRDRTEVIPVQKIASKDGSDIYFLTGDGIFFRSGILVTLNSEGVITDMVLDIVNNDEALAAITEQFIGKKGPFVDGVNISVIPEERYTSQAIIDTVNNLYGGKEAAQVIKDTADAEAKAKADAIAQAEKDKIRTATAKGMISDVTVTLTMENGVIAAITVDSSKETPTFGTRCATDEAFLNQFIGQSLPVENVDAVSGATTTSNAVIQAVNSLAD